MLIVCFPDRVIMVARTNGIPTILAHPSAMKSGEKVKLFQMQSMKGDDRKC